MKRAPILECNTVSLESHWLAWQCRRTTWQATEHPNPNSRGKRLNATEARTSTFCASAAAAAGQGSCRWCGKIRRWRCRGRRGGGWRRWGCSVASSSFGHGSILLHRQRLECSLGLIGRWIDAERHAHSAMLFLSAIKPCKLSVNDLVTFCKRW